MSRVELPSLRIGNHEVEFPISQGGMSIRIAGAELATSVTKSGGLGTIGGVGRGYGLERYEKLPFFKADRQALLDELHKAKEIDPEGVWGVNLLVAVKDYDNLVRTAIKGGAKFIVSGAGLPLHLPALTQDHPEVALIPIVSSTKAVRVITEKWLRNHGRLPDAIVIEEPSTAGGHLGVTSRQTIYDRDLQLVNAIPESRDWIESQQEIWRKNYPNLKRYYVPLIAAGGMWDSSDIKRMLDLGANGVQMGTRFVCTDECEAPHEFKQKYLKAGQDDIVLVKSPVGIPGRAVRTEFSEEAERKKTYVEAHPDYKNPDYICPAHCLQVCSYRSSKGRDTYCIIEALHNAQTGDVDHGIVFAGTNAYRSKEQGIVPVRKIFEELTTR